MKKMFLFLIVSAVFCSCSQSPEKKAQNLIKENMKEVLKDPSSYEAVSFSQLDSLFSPYIGTEVGKQLFDLQWSYQKKASDFEMEVSNAIWTKSKQEIIALEDSVKVYKEKASEAEKLFEENDAKYNGEFVSWKMKHTYRAKNSLGALVVEEKEFYFNKDLTEIIKPYGKPRNK